MQGFAVIFLRFFKKALTARLHIDIICFVSLADVAQLAEQLICNQQVAGSSPIVGSTKNIGTARVCGAFIFSAVISEQV